MHLITLLAVGSNNELYRQYDGALLFIGLYKNALPSFDFFLNVFTGLD